MEILLVLIVIAVIAAAAFMYMRSRGGAPGVPGRGGRRPVLRGRRGAARAAHHDPMAEAVERHAQATDPHEAAEAELRLQAQANRVASDLHAQQASTLESQAGGRGPTGRAPAADAYGRDSLPARDDGAAYYDEQGRPVYPEDRPRY